MVLNLDSKIYALHPGKLRCFLKINGLFRGGFLTWWYPTTIGFPTKNDHFGGFSGYHHFRKRPMYFLLKSSLFEISSKKGGRKLMAWTLGATNSVAQFEKEWQTVKLNQKDQCLENRLLLILINLKLETPEVSAIQLPKIMVLCFPGALKFKGL